MFTAIQGAFIISFDLVSHLFALLRPSNRLLIIQLTAHVQKIPFAQQLYKLLQTDRKKRQNQVLRYVTRIRLTSICTHYYRV